MDQAVWLILRRRYRILCSPRQRASDAAAGIPFRRAPGAEHERAEPPLGECGGNALNWPNGVCTSRTLWASDRVYWCRIGYDSSGTGHDTAHVPNAGRVRPGVCLAGDHGQDTALRVICTTGERLFHIKTESVRSALADEYVPIKCHVDGTLEKFKEPHVLCMEAIVASHRTRREFSDGHGGPGYGHGATEGSVFVVDAQLKVTARGFQRAVSRRSAP